jgi:hypothetical protein
MKNWIAQKLFILFVAAAAYCVTLALGFNLGAWPFWAKVAYVASFAAPGAYAAVKLFPDKQEQ